MSNIEKAKSSLVPIPAKRAIDQKLVTSIIPLERKAILATINKNQVKQLSPLFVKNEVTLIIAKTAIDAGINTQELSLTQIQMGEDVINDFSDFTIDEIELAFYLGVRKHYGEYMGLSVVSFYNFLKSYRNNEKKIAIKFINEHWQRVKDDERNKITRINNLKEAEKTILSQIKHIHDYITNNTDKLNISDFNNILYEHLSELGIITLTIPERKEIFKKAEQQFKQQLITKEKAKKKTPVNNEKIEEKINDIIKKIITDKKPDLVLIKSIAKNISLFETIEKLKKQNVNFWELYQKAIKSHAVTK